MNRIAALSFFIALGIGQAAAEETMSRESTMQPFAPGDVFLGATVLNNPDDDHAGWGRIIQYDSDLNEKGVLWTEGTTHLITGLSFAPDGMLWAFDPWQWLILQVSPEGKQLPNQQFDTRAFARAHFDSDTVYLIENLKGANQPEPLTTRFKPMPGETEKLGDGGIYAYSPDGTLKHAMQPDIHGGMSGSMAVTHSVMSDDGKTIIYVSETGPRLMAYDIKADKQLPDLKSAPDNTGVMFFDLGKKPDGTLLVTMGNRVDALTQQGEEVGTWPLEGFGWSIIAPAHDGRYAFVANWFTGEVVKLDMESGEVTARNKVGEKTVAGMVEYWPEQ